MDIFNQFLGSIRQAVIDATKDALQQIKQETCEEWVDRTEIARHLGQSPAWVSDHLHTIPHVKHDKAIKFRKSDVDRWRVETFGRHYDKMENHYKDSSIAENTSKTAWKPIE